MIDYLLKEGFDVHSVVQGRSLFAYLQADVIQYILENTPVDLKRRINDAGDAILHVLLSNGAFNGLRSATDKLSKEEIVELFSVKNNAGDTPLHSSQSFGEGAVEYFLELDLGIVWTMPNSRNETPLSLILTKRKASMHILNTILPSVPFIPPGLVSIVFSQGAIDLQSIQRLADRGADFNEIVNGDAAIMNLVPTSALVRELAKFGVNFNVSDSNNENLLFHAFKSPQDSTDVLELLVKEYKLSVNQANYSGITPLVRAMTLNRPSSEVAKLLELGANPNPTSTTDSPLSLISQFSAHQTERLELLLKAGADPNMKLYNASRTKVVIPLVTILNSSNDEALELLKLLVQYGANLNMRDDVGNTLLHLLEKDVHTKYLLKVIDVHETNIFGQTALWNKGLSPPGFYMILKVDPNLVNYVANDGSTVLFAKHDNEKMLLLSLDNIDLSVVNKRGQSFMHNRYSCPQIFSKLAETYARQSEETKLRIRQAFNHVDAFGRTVLHYVCEHGLTFAKQMIETFELDINPNARTLNLQIGWSEDVVEYLLAKGSNPNAQSPATGDTFLHFICGDPSKADLIRTLLKYGASIDVKNSSGISPADLDPNLKSEYRFATWSVEFATKESKRRENEGPNPDYWEVD
jgi:ankyrin repeat protein